MWHPHNYKDERNVTEIILNTLDWLVLYFWNKMDIDTSPQNMYTV